MIENEVLRK